jgi:prepilin-type N-terminal cleavage/methylation domain-containing protein
MNPPDHHQGFTLVELLLTLIIMAVALFALSALKNATLRSTVSAQRVIEAVACAEEQMEIIKAQGHAHIMPETGYDCPGSRFQWRMDTPGPVTLVEDLLEEIVVMVECADGLVELELRTLSSMAE